MTDTGSRDRVKDAHVRRLLARAEHLTETEAAAFGSRWPLPEPPDGDLILIHVPGRGRLATDEQVDQAHRLAGQAVQRCAEALGHRASLPRRWACALAAAQEVAVALTVRPRRGLGDTNWYLAHTETWRQVIGDPHPSDHELEAESEAFDLYPPKANRGSSEPNTRTARRPKP